MRWYAPVYLLLLFCTTLQAAPFLVKEQCSGPDGFIPLNGKLLYNIDFPCDSLDSGLYISDGTRPGTGWIHGLSIISADARDADWLVVGRKVYFTASSSASNTGVELWTSDGTTSGTYMVKDII